MFETENREIWSNVCLVLSRACVLSDVEIYVEHTTSVVEIWEVEHTTRF